MHQVDKESKNFRMLATVLEILLFLAVKIIDKMKEVSHNGRPVSPNYQSIILKSYLALANVA